VGVFFSERSVFAVFLWAYFQAILSILKVE